MVGCHLKNFKALCQCVVLALEVAAVCGLRVSLLQVYHNIQAKRFSEVRLQVFMVLKLWSMVTTVTCAANTE